MNFIRITNERGEVRCLNVDLITDFGYDSEADVTLLNFLGEEGTRRYKGDCTDEIFRKIREKEREKE